MKHRLWIALALALALTLTAFADEMIPTDGAEDALIVGDLPTEGEAEPTVEEADEGLPGDIALEEEIADMPLSTQPEPPSTLPAKPDATLLAKLTASGKRALKLSWTKVEGAQGYDVFLGLCKEGSFKKAATVTGARNCKLKGLKRGRTYQAYVWAWKKSGGKKTYIGKSPTVYAITGGNNSTRCNPKSVKVSKSSLKLKTGKSAKVRARVKGVKPGRKGLHQCKLVRWYSSNRNVAKVNDDGKVTAVAKGKCTVYAVANNGARASVKVTVK